jgi:hypothetical protein
MTRIGVALLASERIMPEELQADVVSGLKPLVGILCQAGAADVNESRRRGRLERRDQRRILFPDGGSNGDARFSFNSALPGGHFIEHSAERKNVAAGAGLFSVDLFGRHVLQRADNGAGGGRWRRGTAHGGEGFASRWSGRVGEGIADRGLGQTEVHEFGTGLGEHDVGWL